MWGGGPDVNLMRTELMSPRASQDPPGATGAAQIAKPPERNSQLSGESLLTCTTRGSDTDVNVAFDWRLRQSRTSAFFHHILSLIFIFFFFFNLTLLFIYIPKAVRQLVFFLKDFPWVAAFNSGSLFWCKLGVKVVELAETSGGAGGPERDTAGGRSFRVSRQFRNSGCNVQVASGLKVDTERKT